MSEMQSSEGRLSHDSEKKKPFSQRVKEISSVENLPIFKNWLGIDAKDGSEIKVAVSQNALVEHFLRLMPEVVAVNEQMFQIHGRTLKGLSSSKKLAVAMRKKDILLDFSEKLTYGVPLDEFYEAALQEVPQYQFWSEKPLWPPLPDTLCLQHIEPQKTGALDELVNFFCPAREVDRSLLKAAFISPAWSNGWGARPLFLIGGENKEFDDDQGTGKSTVIQILEKLYGVSATISNSNSDRLIAQFQSLKNQNIRLVKVDNIRDNFSNSILESYITEEWIGGYKLNVGHSSVRNDFTFFATGNSPHCNKDMADRICLIKLKKPKNPDPAWKDNVYKFVAENQERIFADIGWYLMQPQALHLPLSKGCERWGRWVTTVLHKVDPQAHVAMGLGKGELLANEDHQIFADRFAIFATHYYRSASSTTRIDPQHDTIFVPNDLVFDIYRDAFSLNVRRSPAVFAKIADLAAKLGWTKSRMGVRIEGLGQPKGYFINFKPEDLCKPVYLIIKHHKSGQDAVWHQPTSDFLEYLS
jgi:hypothetical protein